MCRTGHMPHSAASLHLAADSILAACFSLALVAEITCQAMTPHVSLATCKLVAAAAVCRSSLATHLQELCSQLLCLFFGEAGRGVADHQQQ